MSIIKKIKAQQEKSKTVHQKYINGGYGLVKTFWLFWFLPVVIITVIGNFDSTKGSLLPTNIAIIALSIFGLISIYNTNSQNGKALWKYVALIFIGLMIISNAFALF